MSDIVERLRGRVKELEVHAMRGDAVTMEQMAEALDGILEKYALPRVNPTGWTDADYERIADWVEPMRREIETLREKALMST